MSRAKLMVGAIAAGCLFASGCYWGWGPRGRVYIGPAPVVIEAGPVAPEGEVAIGVAQPPPPADVMAPAPGP